jgi:hypothetical protein
LAASSAPHQESAQKPRLLPAWRPEIAGFPAAILMGGSNRQSYVTDFISAQE